MDLAWNVVADRVHSREVAVLFLDTRPVDAIAFRHDLLGADGPKSYFTKASK
ncbi:hypothetical protein [Arthrobacter sp. P2b]|uniref:hypothetical protein n=1 Tax=Arthrobacter sp. P2b TaxID=1938741 RepID=UPI00158FBF75|nr:hypothetical protein [Arthrobacter sp. P2b]